MKLTVTWVQTASRISPTVGLQLSMSLLAAFFDLGMDLTLKSKGNLEIIPPAASKGFPIKNIMWYAMAPYNDKVCFVCVFNLSSSQ